MSTPKLSKAVVLYFGPELLDAAGRTGTTQKHGAACGKCVLFDKTTSVCGILAPNDNIVSANNGVCGLFIGGPPSVNSGDFPAVYLTKEQVGYIQSKNVPTTCGGCEYYQMGRIEFGSCTKVEGTIHRFGCCNMWEAEDANAQPGLFPSSYLQQYQKDNTIGKEAKTSTN